MSDMIIHGPVEVCMISHTGQRVCSICVLLPAIATTVWPIETMESTIRALVPSEKRYHSLLTLFPLNSQYTSLVAFWHIFPIVQFEFLSAPAINVVVTHSCRYILKVIPN